MKLRSQTIEKSVRDKKSKKKGRKLIVNNKNCCTLKICARLQ